MYLGSCSHSPEMGFNPIKYFAELFTVDNLEAFLGKVHKQSFKKGAYDSKRVEAYTKVFTSGIIDHYEAVAGKIDFDTPDHKMLESLKNNAFHFSAAKNRAEINSLSSALRDANGKLRGFKDFKVEASKIVDEYQGAWLQTEYDTALNASTLAARWVEYENDESLMYDTVGDDRVRDSHKKLDGITKPKSDKFWSIYYPPLGWKCRCSVTGSISGRVTPDKDIPLDAIDSVPKMFRENFAEKGIVFPSGHPYYNFSE